MFNTHKNRELFELCLWKKKEEERKKKEMDKIEIFKFGFLESVKG